MERLTDFELEQWDNQNPFWNVNIRKLIDEVKEYRQLEKELGCPLEVRCKITNGLSIYDKEGNRWIISQIEETYIDVYSSKDSYYTMIFPYRDYKKTWWLKEDRSE